MNLDQFRARQKETTVAGLKMSFVDQGQGPALLLIHGIPVWGYLWKDCLEPLAAHFRVIVPDLAGYGYSDQRDSFDRSIKVQARLLAELLKQLRIEELFVVGHDIGGAVAQRLVVDNATRVRKWVLMDSVLYDSWPAEPMVRLGNPQQHYRNSGSELAQKFIQRLPASFHQRDRATPELLAAWMAPYMSDTGKLSLIRNAAALNTNHTMEMLADLRRLTIPLLLLWGEKDQFQPLATAERFHQEYPRSQLRVIPDSDHFLPLEKGAEVAQILRDFLLGE
ncbi:MAG: alpha/beta hydrolase [Candidatus Promineifilaceae bacterium]|nr:alpha/beta hydrolase [Candidatus Promineifilaceae bacterium]